MSKYLISLILLSVISMGVSAQRITRQYNNVSFSAALKDLNARQDKYVINFVYDELEDFKVTKNIKNESVPDAIMNLIGFYPIKMKQVDNIIIVECIQKTSNRMMGRIVDTRHQPVDFANVALLNVSDSSFITGGVTNEDGQFVIPCEVKKAIVKVSCVGYKTYCNAYRTGEVGAITLEDAISTLLPEIILSTLSNLRLGLTAVMKMTKNPRRLFVKLRDFRSIFPSLRTSSRPTTMTLSRSISILSRSS